MAMFPNASTTTGGATLPPMESFRVLGLETVEPAYAQFQGAMYAGLLPVTHESPERTVEGEMMFWLFEPDTQEVENTLVIWLNGGPGCSSFNCGVMMEHSPVTQPLHDAGFCCLKPTPDLFYNDNAWTRGTTMLYVEQPIGTGFSYGTPLPENELDASSDLWVFMLNFYQVFDHLKDYDFFIFGESYAGMFVPSIAHYFYHQNLKYPDPVVKLKGAAIGNGWMDPTIQGPATIDYSWWHGLIDQPTRDALHNEWENCYHGRQPGGGPFHSLNVQDDCGIMWGILLAAGNPNAYDITTWDPNVDQVTFTSEAFYNREDVKHMLHAPEGITWHGCRWGAGRRRRLLSLSGETTSLGDRHRRLYMDNDRPWSVVPYVADLVDHGIPVLVYNGDRDMTTNMVGTELALNQMSWSGKKEWLDAPRGVWKVDGAVAGWAKELDNLKFVVVYNSGHMVPYNRPVQAYDLMKRFLRGQKFVDEISPSIRIERLPKSELSYPGVNKKTEVYKPDKDATSTLASLAYSPPGLTSSSWTVPIHHTAAVALLSMVIGALLAVFWSNRRRSSTDDRRYEPIPNAEPQSK